VTVGKGLAYIDARESNVVGRKFLSAQIGQSVPGQAAPPRALDFGADRATPFWIVIRPGRRLLIGDQSQRISPHRRA